MNNRDVSRKCSLITLIIMLTTRSDYCEENRFNVSGEVTVCSNRSTITVVCEGGQVEVDARSCHWNRDGSLNYTGGVFGVHQNMRRSGANQDNRDQLSRISWQGRILRH